MRSLLLGALPLFVACGTTAHPLEVAIPVRETPRAAGPPTAVKPEEKQTSGLLDPYSDAPIEKMSLEDISEEARAQGFTVSGWDMVDTGITIHATWRPRPSSGQFLGIRVFDLPNGAGEVSRAGYDRALELDVFRGRVLGEIVAPPEQVFHDFVENLPSHGSWSWLDLDRSAEKLGFRGYTSTSPQPPRTLGVERITGATKRENTALTFTYFDYARARAENRVLVDGARLLVVTGCSSCSRFNAYEGLIPGDKGTELTQPEDVEVARSTTRGIAARSRALHSMQSQ